MTARNVSIIAFVVATALFFIALFTGTIFTSIPVTTAGLVALGVGLVALAVRKP